MKKNHLSIVLLLVIILLSKEIYGEADKANDVNANDTLVQESLANYKYLYATTSYLTNNGGGSVTVSASTDTTMVVDSVYVKAYLQKYNNGVWVNVYNVSETQTFSDYASVYKDYTVSAGKYRVMSIHQATKNGVMESTTQYTAEKTIY